jgi:hypothetical protein
MHFILPLAKATTFGALSCNSKSQSLCQGIAYANINPRQTGINFENQVHHIISSYLTVTNILRERDIINQFGQTCTAIDHMFDDIETSTKFCIQSKWKNSKESLDYIHHFIKCVETVEKLSTYKVQGIMLSKQPITTKSETAFRYENLSNQKINFINIHLDQKEQDLEQETAQTLLIDKLLEYLHHVYQIWTYDSDGSVVMR